MFSSRKGAVPVKADYPLSTLVAFVSEFLRYFLSIPLNFNNVNMRTAVDQGA